MMPCPNGATEQYVFVDHTGRHVISEPMCEECSHDSQPAETVAVFNVQGEGLDCHGKGPHL